MKKLKGALAIAVKKHQEWLRSQGLYPPKKRAKGVIKIPNYGPPRHAVNEDILQKVGGIAPVNSIWEKVRTGEESATTVEEIQKKARRVAPAYNKGSTQYITDGADLSDLGRKK